MIATEPPAGRALPFATVIGGLGLWVNAVQGRARDWRNLEPGELDALSARWKASLPAAGGVAHPRRHAELIVRPGHHLLAGLRRAWHHGGAVLADTDRISYLAFADMVVEGIVRSDRRRGPFLALRPFKRFEEADAARGLQGLLATAGDRYLPGGADVSPPLRTRCDPATFADVMRDIREASTIRNDVRIIVSIRHEATGAPGVVPPIGSDAPDANLAERAMRLALRSFDPAGETWSLMAKGVAEFASAYRSVPRTFEPVRAWVEAPSATIRATAAVAARRTARARVVAWLGSIGDPDGLVPEYEALCR